MTQPLSFPEFLYARSCPAGTLRVLVLEPDPAMQSVFAAVLSHFGHCAVFSNSTEEALRLLDSSHAGERISVITSDNSDYFSEGMILAEMLRERKIHFGLLIYATHISRRARDVYIKLGVRSILTKPTPAAELMEAIVATACGVSVSEFRLLGYG